MSSPLSSSPAIIVIETNDVVLAKITARLHLDQLEIDLTRILQAMDGADRDIDGLVLVHRADLIAQRHHGCAAYHHPMLGTMMVLLQREAAAGFHHNPFHLVALAI